MELQSLFKCRDTLGNTLPCLFRQNSLNYLGDVIRVGQKYMYIFNWAKKILSFSLSFYNVPYKMS